MQLSYWGGAKRSGICGLALFKSYGGLGGLLKFLQAG